MMKKITFMLTALFSLVLTNAFAQGSCATAVPLTPGTQQCGDTSSGADVYDGNTCLGNYDGGDDYIFSYVATATGESLTLDLTGVAGWTGFAMSDDCPDAGTYNCMGSATTTSAGDINFTSDPLTSGVTYYIHISTYPSPQSTAFCLDAVVNPAPTCLDPDTFAASNVTSNTVDLSWNDPSGIQFDFEYVVQASGVGMPAGSGVAVGATSATGISNELDTTPLAPNTPYEAWVRADCGGGDYSAWVGPVNFTTPCNPYTIPYFEGFESGYVDQAAVDGCLSQETITGTQVWTANNTSTTYNRTPRTGAWNAYLRYSNDDWLFIPIDLTGGTSYTVELYARQDGATATNSDITVSYGTTGDAAGMINTIVPATGIVNGNYQQITGSFTPASTGTYYVGIKGYMNGSPWYISLDDISIDVTPACPAPSGVMASNVTSTTADLSWNATTGNYEYVLDLNPADPAGSGTAIAGETYNATVLTPETTYYFHVRSDCGSTWTTISFTTPATPPANDDCANAEVLTPGAVFTDNPVVGTNVGATDSGETAPGCASYSGGDVWYSVEVPASGSITIETNSNSDVITDSGLAVYSGTCGSLTLIECDDDDSPDGAFSLVALTSRTPGEILYVNVWEYGNNAFGSMQVSAYDASLSSNSFDSNSFVAYPNPVKNVLTLEYSNEISSVSVYNMLGQEVLSRTIDATSTQIDMSQLNAGTYLVNVTSGDIQKTIKVVKQ